MVAWAGILIQAAYFLVVVCFSSRLISWPRCSTGQFLELCDSPLCYPSGPRDVCEILVRPAMIVVGGGSGTKEEEGIEGGAWQFSHALRHRLYGCVSLVACDQVEVDNTISCRKESRWKLRGYEVGHDFYVVRTDCGYSV
ncbi:hypothetical protein K456DRAFT_1043101 [Colletotrichum gloeosporioides 23]|nr:hypothetical protein K456DRAFT_1043101 [Colletotrichum gloeosporioides 23]